jgi:DNA-binding transcriptional LysR family regulator
MLPRATSTLLRTAPGTTVNVIVGTGTVELLRNGELDLVLALNLPQADKELVQEHLYDDEIVVYASKNHRLARKKSVTLADIAQERYVMPTPDTLPMRLLIQALEERGLPSPKVTMISNSLWLRLMVVGVTNLLILDARRTSRRIATLAALKDVSVVDFKCVWRVGITYRKDTYVSPVARRFIEILKATAKEMAAE